MITVLCFVTVSCKDEEDEVVKKAERFPSLVLQLMYDMFGINNVQQSEDKMIHVTLDNNTAKLDPFNVVSIYVFTYIHHNSYVPYCITMCHCNL